jgi:hypothetical protein
MGMLLVEVVEVVVQVVVGRVLVLVLLMVRERS